jgi:hypothetical protein
MRKKIEPEDTMKKRKMRVIWVIEDCKWKTLRGDWCDTKKEALLQGSCNKCKAVKFIEADKVKK